jgi:peptidoglycan/xylan/chitin deacetylase (PgdA/CDA1 family)
MAKRIIVCADCEGTPDQLERLWRAVERHDIKVNFFFTGETALENGDLVREIARTQNVDSHTFSHPNLRALSKAGQRDEILRGKETVESVIGRETFGFRAPYHCINRDTVDLLNEEGFVYDLSGLYFRYHMREVIEIHPTWFREWVEIYGLLRLSPRFAWDIIKGLYKIFDPLVIPLHPHYSGRSDVFAAAMEEFMVYALERGAQFCFVPEYLRQTGKWGNGR